MQLTEIGVMRNPNHYASWGSADGTPHWPEYCSVCYSKHIGDGEYTCGAKYVRKPQIQTHTEIYWGECPKI